MMTLRLPHLGLLWKLAMQLTVILLLVPQLVSVDALKPHGCAALQWPNLRQSAFPAGVGTGHCP